MSIDAFDLFCGVGGLSYGLSLAGINVRGGLDFDAACEYPYTANIDATFMLEDVSKVDADKIRSFFRSDNYSLLAGCAPCQPFSTLRNGINRKKSDKWPLLNEFGRLVAELEPDFVTMENVPVLQNQAIFKRFVKTLHALNYEVFHDVVDAADYGVAQRRRRLVLLASRHGTIRLLSPEELSVTAKVVKDAIGHLNPLAAGECDADDPLHKARALTPINLARIKASKQGGTWQDWAPELRAPCHRAESGATYKSVYARMCWDAPAPTMTTQCFNFGTGRFGHPEQDRAITLREAAILQSFPEDYIFVRPGDNVHFSTLGRLIGNAVPVDLGQAIGKSIQAHVETRQEH